MMGMSLTGIGRIALLAAVCAASCDEPAAPTPVQPPATLAALAVAPGTVDAGASSQGTVSLTGPAATNGMEIRLSSSDGVAVVPASLTVPGGAASATFTVTTRVVAAEYYVNHQRIARRG